MARLFTEYIQGSRAADVCDNVLSFAHPPHFARFLTVEFTHVDRMLSGNLQPQLKSCSKFARFVFTQPQVSTAWIDVARCFGRGATCRRDAVVSDGSGRSGIVEGDDQRAKVPVGVIRSESACSFRE